MLKNPAAAKVCHLSEGWKELAVALGDGVSDTNSSL